MTEFVANTPFAPAPWSQSRLTGTALRGGQGVLVFGGVSKLWIKKTVMESDLTHLLRCNHAQKMPMPHLLFVLIVRS
ncbi:MAG: hypothetical protein AAF558_00440 [Verrucomicrobiota bacterium]